jgi:hypothetical protein
MRAGLALLRHDAMSSLDDRGAAIDFGHDASDMTGSREIPAYPRDDTHSTGIGDDLQLIERRDGVQPNSGPNSVSH